MKNKRLVLNNKNRFIVFISTVVLALCVCMIFLFKPNNTIQSYREGFSIFNVKETVKETLSKDLELYSKYEEIDSMGLSEGKLLMLKELSAEIVDTDKEFKKLVSDKINELSDKISSLHTGLDNLNIELGAKAYAESLDNLKKQFFTYDFSEYDKILADLQEKEAEKLKQEKELAEKQVEPEAVVTVPEDEEISSSTPVVDKPVTPEASKPTGIGTTYAAQNSNQLITVVSKGGALAETARWQKDSSGNWTMLDSAVGHIGSGGMKYGPNVYNWDMCTPTGNYSLSEAFGAAPNPGSGLPYRVLDGSEYWVDDESSPLYNTLQFGEPNGRWNSAEHLLDYKNAYAYSIVVDYNRYPVSNAGSSAIFLHCDTGSPTWGCISVPESYMQTILTWLNPSSNPRILIDFSYDDIYSNY